MKTPDVNPPAIVQPADAKAELLAAFAAFEDSGRKRLEAAIRIGGILTERKKTVGHGNWLKWLEAHFPYDRQRAADFIRVYLERGKCSRAATFEDALRIIAGEPEPEEEPAKPEPPEPPPAPDDDEQPEPAEPESEGGETDEATEQAAPTVPTPQPEPTDGTIPIRDYPARREGNLVPGNKVDPNHPFADVLAKMTELTIAINKALASPDSAVLREYLAQLNKYKVCVPMVWWTNQISKAGGTLKDARPKFIGLHLLRGLVRRAGKHKRAMPADKLRELFAELCSAKPEDIIAEDDAA